MHAGDQNFHPDLRGLEPADWMQQFRAITTEHGFCEALGQHHVAGFVDAGDTLVVSFETLPRLRQMTGGTPMGFELCESFGWSALTLVARGDTWFRAGAVAQLFDNLRDDGFFSEFQNVLFVGAGPAGYAACTYARACPEARVLALAPQATLDPRLAGWDNRFKRMRRLPFAGAYGYAPDGLAQVRRAHILFDPHNTEDAMHAALFQGDRVTHHPMPFMGDTLERDLRKMRVLTPLLYAAGTGALSAMTFARLLRARRDNPAYLRRLLAHLDHAGRPGLAKLMCTSVLRRREVPSLRRWLEERA